MIGWATIVIAYRVENGDDGSILIGGVFAGVGALYIGKAWEIAKSDKQPTEIEIA